MLDKWWYNKKSKEHLYQQQRWSARCKIHLSFQHQISSVLCASSSELVSSTIAMRMRHFVQKILVWLCWQCLQEQRTWIRSLINGSVVWRLIEPYQNKHKQQHTDILQAVEWPESTWAEAAHVKAASCHSSKQVVRRGCRLSGRNVCCSISKQD